MCHLLWAWVVVSHRGSVTPPCPTLTLLDEIEREPTRAGGREAVGAGEDEGLPRLARLGVLGHGELDDDFARRLVVGDFHDDTSAVFGPLAHLSQRYVRYTSPTCQHPDSVGCARSFRYLTYRIVTSVTQLEQMFDALAATYSGRPDGDYLTPDR